MSTLRRTVLMAAGGAGLALVGAGALFAATRRPTAALRPWEEAGAPAADIRLEAFRHAILAPNPHNRQPWRIRLVGADAAEIACDLDRRLPQTDPFDRQITIGFGAFLELARIAAAERGVLMDTVLFPEGEPQPRLTAAPVARLRFVPDPDAARDPLFAAITSRRSAKIPFDLGRAVPEASLAAIRQAGGPLSGTRLSAEPGLVRDLRALTWRAWMVEATTSRTWKESVDLMRIGRSEIEANPDGIAVGGVVVGAMALLGQVDRAGMADPGSSAFRFGVEKYQTMLAQTPAYLWIASPDNSRAAQIAAGRAYVRANLGATAAGLSMQPVSQALQEFAEMGTEYDTIHNRLDVKAPARLQMLARVGYGAPVDPAARWPVAAKLVV